MREIRKHYIEDRGLDRSVLRTQGYWKMGDINHPDHGHGGRRIAPPFGSRWRRPGPTPPSLRAPQGGPTRLGAAGKVLEVLAGAAH